MVRTPRPLHVLAPTLLLAGAFLHPEEPTTGAELYPVLREHATAWSAAHWLLLAGVTALIPVLLWLAAEVRAAAPRLSLTAAVLGVAGACSAAAVFGTSLALGEMGEGPRDAMVPLVDRVLGLWSVLLPGVLALVTSVVLLAAVLLSTRRITGVAAGLVGAGFVAEVMAPEPFACAGGLLFLVGMVLVARQLEHDAVRPAPSRATVSV